jgi:hypothetical protein
MLTAHELAFLKTQEAAGKISLHTAPHQSLDNTAIASSNAASLTFNIPNPHTNTQPGIVYTHLFPDTSTLHTPNNTTNPYTNTPPNPSAPPPQFHTPEPNRQHSHNNFSLSIARPKLDFPTFSRDEPVNWLRQCEKYFVLASVPMDTWVPLASLHCYGMAQTWWRSLRTPTNFVHWAQFCNMIFSRFSTCSTHSSLKQFHHLKQQTSVSDYIQKFKELMALMQMQHPGLSKQYYISDFIAGLNEGIKHYLVPQNPQALSNTSWQAKELEKGILAKKSLLSTSSSYTKPTLPFTPTTPHHPNQPNHNLTHPYP